MGKELSKVLDIELFRYRDILFGRLVHQAPEIVFSTSTTILPQDPIEGVSTCVSHPILAFGLDAFGIPCAGATHTGKATVTKYMNVAGAKSSFTGIAKGVTRINEGFGRRVRAT